MKLYFILLLGSLGAVVPVRAQEPPAQDCEIVALPSGGRIVRWLGYPGRTYFMQVSSQAEPLANWTWMPIIESGSGEEISYEIDGTASRAFFRLQYTDQVSANPDLSDFDQDGLSNAQELQQQTDPFDPDTDDDGLGDGWEFLAGSDPRDNGTVNFASGPNGDTDGDGATNAAEAAAGTDANQAGSFPPRVEWHRRYGEMYFSAGWGGNQFDSGAGYGSPQTITHPLSGSPLASTAVASTLASDHPFPTDTTVPTGRQQLFPSLDVEAHGTYHYSEINPDTGESFGAHAFLSQTRIWLKLPDTSTSQNPRKFPYLLTEKHTGWVAGSAPIQLSLTRSLVEFTISPNATISNTVDLVPEFPSLQPGARSDKELKLQSLGISVTSTTPALTQLDGICVVKNTVLTFSIPSVAAESSLTLDWEIRQLQRNGSLGEWVSVGQGNPFDYTAEDPGIYQLRAQIDIGSAVVESVWSRQNDENGGADSHGTFNELYRMGEPDFFGVATAPVQLEIRKQARLNLNSTAYALAASLNLFIGGPTYSSTQNKCNAFVYHKASDAGAPVPLINGFPLEYPPTAYDWWDGFTEIDGWTRLNGYHWMEDYRPPEPGFVVAGPDESAHPYFARYGHVGILDYDGGWIQAGSVTVNKNPHLISHQLAPYQPAGFREYRGQQ